MSCAIIQAIKIQQVAMNLPKELVLSLSVLYVQNACLCVWAEESCSLKQFRIHRLSNLIPASSHGPALVGALKLCPRHSQNSRVICPQGRVTQSLAFKTTLQNPHFSWSWTRNTSGHGVYFSLMSSKRYFSESNFSNLQSLLFLSFYAALKPLLPSKCLSLLST